MTISDIAYKYWAVLKNARRFERLDLINTLGVERCKKSLQESIQNLGLTESAERLFDKEYQASLEATYGCDIETTPVEFLKMRFNVRQKAGIDPKYVDLLELTKLASNEMNSSYAIQSWLRNKGTVEILMLWEMTYNPEFDSAEAKRLVTEVKETNSTLTLKRCIARTGATGVVSLQGRYGGTYAHRVIARDYNMWLSPQVRFGYLSVAD